MKKKIIRLTESDLHKIIRNSVNRILREEIYDGWGHEPLPDGFYVFVETNYSLGNVCSVVDRDTAEDAQNSSEGHVEGPYASYEDARNAAMEYAEREGYEFLDEQ